jgi:hypothetical protein
MLISQALTVAKQIVVLLRRFFALLAIPWEKAAGPAVGVSFPFPLQSPVDETGNLVHLPRGLLK